MEYTKDKIYEMMNHKNYPLSSKYNPEWILQNAMGSHCLWLQEAVLAYDDITFARIIARRKR